ncbi:MAG: cytochrome c biogenesis protein CcdA [Elusimicrobia bacterium]|nr:cytochrome c biogenesis protein CcdA [Elusimicrobiota bacterium]
MPIISPLELFSALFAGLATFFSPCVLPLIPGYLSLISGLSAAEILQEQGPSPEKRHRVMLSATLFVSGFSCAFVLLGTTASMLGGFFLNYGRQVEIISGILLLFFGAYLLGLFNFVFLNYEKRFSLHKFKPGYWGALLMGFAFALGWTPCIGPVLAGLLALAASGDTAWKGALLLLAYSMGLGVPLLLAALGARKLVNLAAKHRRLLAYGERLAGIVFVVIGIMLLLSGKMPLLKNILPV